MNEQFNEEMMIRYLQGTCLPEEKIQFETWLDGSEENRNQFYQTRLLWYASRIEYYRSEEPLNNAQATFTDRVQYGRQQKRKRIYIQMARYAAILIGVLAVLWIYLVTREHKASDNTMITASVLRTDSSKLVVLEDGSRVWLNSNSHITYPRNFSNDKRTVTFEGEAYFDVAHDPARPFLVQTSTMQVKVLGTAFNVQAYSGAAEAEAVLVRGKISIGDSSGRELAVIAPGQRVLFQKSNHSIAVTNVNSDAYTSWRNGQIILNAANLATITRKLTELYQVKFSVEAPVIDTTRYNFTFSKTKPVTEVMDMLCFIAPVHYHIQGKDIVITK